MEIPLLTEIEIIFGLSIAVLFICHRLRVPTIVGFLLTGLFVGPYGFGLVKAIHNIEIFTEVGVVLLLFTIGIEFSLKRLLQIRKTVLIGGPLQVLITFLVTAFVAGKYGQPAGKAVFMGFLAALSSTAIVLKMLQERAEVESPQGRTALGILIFQDIIVVPMILLIPLLAGTANNFSESFILLMLKGAGIIVLVIAGAKWIVPQLLYQIAKTRNNELFLLSLVVICFGVAWLTAKAGLSLALGAFLAGLIISESEYSLHALGNILPFRDVFTTFFFVSIGMMLDIRFIIQEPLFILLMAAGVLVLKALIAGSATVLLGFPLRTAIITGLTLSQIGEFSFILSRIGLEQGLITGDIYQRFLAVTVITMAATPFIIGLAPRLADQILKIPFPRRLISGFFPVSEKETIEQKDHLVIIGYGVNGRNVARAARFAGIPYAIIEMNPETVRSEQAKGEAVYYGDATQEAVLESVHIQRARIAVVAINDPTATRRVTELIRRLNPGVYLIVRTRYLNEMDPLCVLGANDVIPEEFETSVEIFTRVLTRYLIPRDEIERLVNEVRTDSYEMFRNMPETQASFEDLKLQIPNVDISALRISEDSFLAGKTLGRAELRKRYGVSVVAIQRDSQIISDPGADSLIQTGDVIYVLGSSGKLTDAIAKFSSPAKEQENL